jgi:Domain of unknown function (DUF397)
MIDLTHADWRKSTRSSSEGQCVEVAVNLVRVVSVRDSKDHDGGVLIFPRSAWSDFVADLKAGL